MWDLGIKFSRKDDNVHPKRVKVNINLNKTGCFIIFYHFFCFFRNVFDSFNNRLKFDITVTFCTVNSIS